MTTTEPVFLQRAADFEAVPLMAASGGEIFSVGANYLVWCDTENGERLRRRQHAYARDLTESEAEAYKATFDGVNPISGVEQRVMVEKLMNSHRLPKARAERIVRDVIAGREATREFLAARAGRQYEIIFG